MRLEADGQLRFADLVVTILLLPVQLNYSEKGIRKMAELFKSYQEALFDDEVVEALKVDGLALHICAALAMNFYLSIWHSKDK